MVADCADKRIKWACFMNRTSYHVLPIWAKSGQIQSPHIADEICICGPEIVDYNREDGLPIYSHLQEN